MTSNSVQVLESDLAGRGFKLSKKYDGTSGICVVTAYNKTTDLTIVSKNSSRAALWNAYKRALEFIIEQLDNYKNVSGVDA